MKDDETLVKSVGCGLRTRKEESGEAAGCEYVADTFRCDDCVCESHDRPKYHSTKKWKRKSKETEREKETGYKVGGKISVANP